MKQKEEKLTKRKIQAINTRKTIIDTAIDLMEKSGFNNITIEDICRRAGISIGTFYHYFKTKHEIFIEILDRGDTYFKRNAVQKLNHKSSIENIRKYFIFYAKLNSDVGSEKLKLLYDTNNKFFMGKGRYLQTLLSGIIAEGQKTNEIKNDISADEITDYLFTVARGIAYHWCISDGGFDIKGKMRIYMDRIIQTIKK